MAITVNLTDLVNLQNETTAVNAINSNNSELETKLQDSVSRSGTSPNQMNSALDMNSNRIMNLADPVGDNDPITKKYFAASEAVRISSLNSYNGALAGTELLEIVRPGNSSGTTVKVTATQVANTTPAKLPTGGSTSQILVKDSDADYVTKWQTISPLVASGLTNTRLAKTAAYTVYSGSGGSDQGDNGYTIALGGSAFYTLTVLPATSGYQTNFLVLVVNEDTTRGKTLAIDGHSNFILWPGQSCIIYRQNTSWQVLPSYQRWRPPGGSLVLHTDFDLGDDNNDGLATGAGNALKTYMSALYVVMHYFDLSAYPQGTITILGKPGNVDTTNIHYSPHGQVGAQGGAAICVDGNGGELTEGAGHFLKTNIQYRRITFRKTLSLAYHSFVDLLDGVKFHPDCVILVTPNCEIQSAGGYEVIGGTGTYHIINAGGTISNSGAVTFSGDATFSNALVLATGGNVSISGGFVSGGHTITGQKYSAFGYATLNIPTFVGDSDGAIHESATVNNTNAIKALVEGGTGATSANAARVNLQIEGNVISHGDTNVTLVAADCPAISLTSSLSAIRTWTLPAANAVSPGRVLAFFDAGGINGSNTLIFTRGGSDTLQGGGASSNAITLSTIHSAVTFMSNGVNGWFVMSKNF